MITVQQVEAKLKSLEQKIAALVNSNKILLVLLIVPLVIIKYRSFIINLLVKDSAQISAATVAQDATLAKQESQDNAKADAAVADAEKTKAASDAQVVTNDWYKK